MLTCPVVRDLLPSYLENLTGPETNRLVEEHLHHCEECRSLKETMEAEIDVKKAPEPKINFLQKWKRRRLISAALAILVTLGCMVWLYDREFSVEASATSSLEAAIDEFNFEENLEVNVLESEHLGDRLVVLYQKKDSTSYHGIAELQRGIFGKYRFLRTSNSDWDLYDIETVTSRGKSYLLIYGINDLPGVKTFSVLRTPEDAGTLLYKGEGRKAPFLDMVEVKGEVPLFPNAIRYYDGEGREITMEELHAQLGMDRNGGGSGTSVVEGGLLYVYLGIVLVLGIIITRYLLDPAPKRNKDREQGMIKNFKP